MKQRSFGIFAILLCLVTPQVTTQAETIQLSEVVHTTRHSARSGFLASRLNLQTAASQTPQTQSQETQQSVLSTGDQGSTTEYASGRTEETIEISEVVTEACDCPALESEVLGDFFVPGGGGGFPMLSLIGLAALPLPLLFLGGSADSPQPPVPVAAAVPPQLQLPIGPGPITGDTPPAPIPEPATMLLLGSGLAALGGVARRRRARALSTETTGEDEQ